jgi:hypothetical protein
MMAGGTHNRECVFRGAIEDRFDRGQYAARGKDRGRVGIARGMCIGIEIEAIEMRSALHRGDILPPMA